MKGSKDGRQKYRVRVNYQDSSGVNRQIDRVAYGSKEAKDLERDLARKIKNETPAKNITVSQLYDEYVKVKSHEVRETTMRSTKTIIDNHILPHIGSIKLSKLTAPVLTNWKLIIEQKNLSITMRKHIYGELRAMLNYAVKMDYIPKNPLIKVGNFKDPLSSKKEINFYTPEEFKKFIAAARDCAENAPALIEWDYYVFFNIAFYTGLRKGEIHALKWSDINGEYLTVSRSINQKLEGEDRETPPKNKSSIRTLQLPLPLIKILDEHKLRWSEDKNFTEDFRICGGYKSLRDTSIQKKNKLYADTAGVKTIRIHDYRHSHASLLANEGINIQEIARRLGHSKIEITWNTYSHLYPREEERAVDILNKIV